MRRCADDAEESPAFDGARWRVGIGGAARLCSIRQHTLHARSAAACRPNPAALPLIVRNRRERDVRRDFRIGR
jgi:hypothetical protein